MERYFLKSLNCHLSELNIFQCREELLQLNSKKDKLKIEQLINLLFDFKKIDLFLISKVKETNYIFINIIIKEDRIYRKKLLYIIQNYFKSL